MWLHYYIVLYCRLLWATVCQFSVPGLSSSWTAVFKLFIVFLNNKCCIIHPWTSCFITIVYTYSLRVILRSRYFVCNSYIPRLLDNHPLWGSAIDRWWPFTCAASLKAMVTSIEVGYNVHIIMVLRFTYRHENRTQLVRKIVAIPRSFLVAVYWCDRCFTVIYIRQVLVARHIRIQDWGWLYKVNVFIIIIIIIILNPQLKNTRRLSKI